MHRPLEFKNFDAPTLSLRHTVRFKLDCFLISCFRMKA